MKKTLAAAVFLLLIIPAARVSALSPADCYGQWKDATYVVSLNRNCTASVIIYVNPQEAYVFNGVFTIEKDNQLRINISEMKSCPRSKAFAKSGFTKTASSRFVFTAQTRDSRGKMLILRPKEVMIDGNDSAGYFDSELTLRK